jgi:hypothetical protein
MINFIIKKFIKDYENINDQKAYIGYNTHKPVQGFELDER